MSLLELAMRVIVMIHVLNPMITRRRRRISTVSFHGCCWIWCINSIFDGWRVILTKNTKRLDKTYATDTVRKSVRTTWGPSTTYLMCSTTISNVQHDWILINVSNLELNYDSRDFMWGEHNWSISLGATQKVKVHITMTILSVALGEYVTHYYRSYLGRTVSEVRVCFFVWCWLVRWIS